ncbi:MAG: hypothetical protein IM628_10675 [Phenylobacterium sp.]|uniref:hypothetical protein n=1 Tax=Phenylobacterium sp. TaxID=1871053 RepID=UPI0025F0DC30|nr:hypothetical protein [Phenylobacterium sp.]MCA6305265.1 hypothetical protein [Phenylobacterium sp.]
MDQHTTPTVVIDDRPVVTTRAQIAAAFADWITEARARPDDFASLTAGTPEAAGAECAATLVRRLGDANGVRGEADVFWTVDDTSFPLTAGDLREIAIGAEGVPIEVGCSRTLPNFWVAALPAVDDRGDSLGEHVLFEARTREELEALVAAAREPRAAAGGEG